MPWFTKIRTLRSCAVLILVFSGCDQESEILVVGNYQGNLFEPTAGSPPALQQYAVSANITRPTPTSFHIDMTGLPTLAPAGASLDLSTPDGGKTVILDIPGTTIRNAALAADGACFASAQPLGIRLCTRKQSLVLTSESSDQMPAYSLSLEYFGSVAQGIQLETPQSFTLESAVNQAMSRSFNTQIEFQHMLQARLNAKQAYLELIPHLGNTSIVGLTTGGPLNAAGVVGMAGDLVPFLFPGRWIQARESGHLSAAEADTLAIMKGDAGINVEILAYAIDHDERQVDFLKQDYADTLLIRSKVAKLEERHLVPPGTSDHVDSILASLHDAMDDLTYPLQAEYATLSQAMGFVNPQAVTNVQIPDVPPTLLDGEEELNPADFQHLVLDRSIELRQVDHVIDAARTATTADYFNWLDPAAGINQSLGFGLGAQIAIDRSQLAALEAQRGLTASAVLQNLADVVIQYNHSIDDLADSKSGIKLEQGRKDRLMAELDGNDPVSDTEITSVPFDQLTWQINSLDALLDYRSSNASIQRALLQGQYSNLDGTLPQGPGH